MPLGRFPAKKTLIQIFKIKLRILHFRHDHTARAASCFTVFKAPPYTTASQRTWSLTLHRSLSYSALTNYISGILSLF
jgi:hypothetical protein